MAFVEPVDALYDFLYRDSNRIASYYAQMFGGRLSASEETDSRTRGDDKGTKIGSPLAAVHEQKYIDTVQTGSKRTIDPHDVIATEVLAFLRDNGHIYEDVETAPHGALVITAGIVVFIDKSTSNLMQLSMDLLLGQIGDPQTQEDFAQIQLMTFVKQFISPLLK